jgi:methylmalonyl-CoA carboxyltransferase large subunit
VGLNLEEIIQTVSDRQQSTEVQLTALTSAVKALEARVASMCQPPQSVAAITQSVAAEKEEVTPEMLVVIAAAVTAFLGKKVRIRSAKRLRSASGVVSPWSQQGRTLIQASHNLRLKG